MRRRGEPWPIGRNQLQHCLMSFRWDGDCHKGVARLLEHSNQVFTCGCYGNTMGKKIWRRGESPRNQQLHPHFISTYVLSRQEGSKEKGKPNFCVSREYVTEEET